MSAQKSFFVLSVLVSTLVACGKSSDSADKGAPGKSESPQGTTAVSLKDQITANPWCVSYVDMDPTNALYDIRIEERNEYLKNGVRKTDRYDLGKGSDTYRWRRVDGQNKKWELSDNTLTVTSEKGKITVGTVTMGAENKTMKVVWQTGDAGITYKPCK